MTEKVYIAIDLKSFYASVECIDRGLNPLTALLVVADESRTDKTICLAVTPALKALGVPGRPRLFEAKQKLQEANALRRGRVKLTDKTCDGAELASNPHLEADFIIAPPRMAHYMQVSSRVYETYLRFIAPEDIHPYSIDEVFIDATPYLKTYGLTGYELAQKLVNAVLSETGITATAGIGTNLYLAKIAMDIVAKNLPPDERGVRIEELNELTYRQQLWDHKPLTDFWRVGRGYSKRLAKIGIYTMG
ncbi:MAG: DNA methylase, partial [Oscillospiraceae bacterium]|nr:DNA methylase [Oscillospiraceae bacterium]